MKVHLIALLFSNEHQKQTKGIKQKQFYET